MIKKIKCQIKLYFYFIIKAIEALNSIMNYSEHFLIGMRNFTGEDQPFTEVEYTTLEKLINETRVRKVI